MRDKEEVHFCIAALFNIRRREGCRNPPSVLSPSRGRPRTTSSSRDLDSLVCPDFDGEQCYRQDRTTSTFASGYEDVDNRTSTRYTRSGWNRRQWHQRKKSSSSLFRKSHVRRNPSRLLLPSTTPLLPLSPSLPLSHATLNCSHAAMPRHRRLRRVYRTCEFDRVLRFEQQLMTTPSLTPRLDCLRDLCEHACVLSARVRASTDDRSRVQCWSVARARRRHCGPRSLWRSGGCPLDTYVCIQAI